MTPAIAVLTGLALQARVIDSPLDMVLGATTATKIILLVLVIFSLASWILIFWKWREFGRVNEQARKLALLYAVSADHKNPSIDLAAARWASRFVMHQTGRMLFMAQNYVADNPFHAACLKLMQKLRESPDGELPHSVLLKRMKTDARTFLELISTLEQRGDLEIVTIPRAGTARKSYRLRG